MGWWAHKIGGAAFLDMYLDRLNLSPQKEVEDLTVMDQLAIAHAAGCAVEFKLEGGKVVCKTRNPVAIKKIDGKFIVAERI